MVKYPVTRDSDELLYLKVCEHYNPTVLNKSFKQVFVNRLFNGIPSFETVRRCRTKVQSEHEELHSTLEVKQKRQKALEYLSNGLKFNQIITADFAVSLWGKIRFLATDIFPPPP